MAGLQWSLVFLLLRGAFRWRHEISEALQRPSLR